MGSSLFLSMITSLLSLLACFHLIMSTASSSAASIRPLCRDDESLALSQFNQSFVITDNRSVSSDPSAYLKTASWKLGDNSDCCSWDGVKCNDDTGHVIGLDLSSSFLYGSFNSSSSLFHLVHLQKLNLADNHFNHSQIPSRFGHLSRLTYLNLSYSVFSGPIPSKIFQLSKLISLDLFGNLGSFSGLPLLKLEKEPSLNGLLRNLTNLKELNLGRVYISSEIPDILANMTSLESLRLRGCGLHGEFPMAIFQLPNLQVLDVRYNPYLTGYLPEFNKSSPLELLKVARTGFFGKLPDSISNLNSMKELDINGCNFSGSVPSSLGNITHLTSLDISLNHLCGEFPMAIFQLPNLQVLDVGSNPYLTGYLPEFNKSSPLTLLNVAKTGFFGKLPNSIGNLNSMKDTEIYGCNFSGSVPSSLGNLTQLTTLDISSNNFSGSVPSSLGNLTQLTTLDISFNNLCGPFPLSISRLRNLESFFSVDNNLSGIVDFNMFLNLENLVQLELSDINLSFLTSTSINATIPKFTFVGLDRCNLGEFPDFLRHQDELEYLSLAENKIRGQIPKWVWNVGKETLSLMLVHDNFLTGFDEPPIPFPWTSMGVLDLSSNMLKGSLLIPPPSTVHYDVSNNSLTGEISPLICNLTFLFVLDLSNNNFSGILPQCLGNYNDSLSVLNLRNNNFHGAIPQTCTHGSKLGMIDLSQNQLQGWVPRSLSNCEMLEILDLGNNQINDTFPSWLGTSPKLRVLILRSNEFHGAIKDPETNLSFPKLHIIDLSYNSFKGKFPSKYFKNWNSMKIVDEEQLTYMQANVSVGTLDHIWYSHYEYAMTITNKGTNRRYSRIPNIFIAIDLSSNRFEGDIPESIGNLKGLQLLNLSNNILTGHIPSCLGNLTNLESLDLSQNKLSGEIPQQLTGITFLSVLNLSHNHLTGPIPHGNQFDTFPNTSFEGNSRLCGKPLSKKCGNLEASLRRPLTSEQDEDLKFPSGYDWIFILAGCGSGLVVGLVIGHILTTRKHEWFIETFRRKPRNGKGRKKGRGCRSTRT